MDNKILLQDIADFLSRRSGITKREAEQFVRSFFDVIQQGLERDQYVKIKGFGTFKLVEVGQRESVNINTGERFQINGHTKVSFTPDTSLKDLVNRPFSHFQTVILNDETAIEELEACTVPEDFEQQAEDVTTAEPLANTIEEIAQIPAEEIKASEVPPTETPQAVPTEQEVKEEAPCLEAPSESEPAEAKLTEEESSLPVANDEALPTEEPGTIAEAVPEPTSTSEEQVVVVPIPLPTVEEELATSEETTQEEPEEAAIQTEEPSAEPQEDADSNILPPIPKPEALASSIPQESEMEEEKSETDEAEEEPADEDSDSIIAIDTEQGMQYLVGPRAMRKLKRWKTISIVLFVVLFSLASFTLSLLPYYFTDTKVTTRSEETQQIDDEENTYAADTTATDNQLASDTTDVDLITPANVDSIVNSKQAAAKKAPATEKTVAEAKPTPQEVKQQPAKQSSLPQISRGSYKITGTRSTHVVSRGETLMSIAEKEYGSKSYAAYIAAYNGLKDANYVHAGTTLRIPELQPK